MPDHQGLLTLTKTIWAECPCPPSYPTGLGWKWTPFSFFSPQRFRIRPPIWKTWHFRQQARANCWSICLSKQVDQRNVMDKIQPLIRKFWPTS